MKIKDIINEQGFWSGFGKALLPDVIQKVMDVPKPQAELTDADLAKSAYEKFGDAPNKEGLGAVGWLTDPQFRQRIADAKGRMAKKTAKQFVKKTASTATSAPTPSPIVSPTIPTSSNIPQGQRIKVTNPQGTATFYKYPGGKWTDEFGNAMPSGAHGALDQFADTSGSMEPIPVATKTAYQGRGGRRGK